MEGEFGGGRSSCFSLVLSMVHDSLFITLTLTGSLILIFPTCSQQGRERGRRCNSDYCVDLLLSVACCTVPTRRVSLMVSTILSVPMWEGWSGREYVYQKVEKY